MEELSPYCYLVTVVSSPTIRDVYLNHMYLLCCFFTLSSSLFRNYSSSHAHTITAQFTTSILPAIPKFLYVLLLQLISFSGSRRCTPKTCHLLGIEFWRFYLVWSVTAVCQHTQHTVLIVLSSVFIIMAPQPCQSFSTSPVAFLTHTVPKFHP